MRISDWSSDVCSSDLMNDPAIELSEDARHRFEAQAKFFRGYTYKMLATLYGGVPIVTEVLSEPKFDFQRASKEEVLQFARQDLEEAGALLPVVGNVSDGRIYRSEEHTSELQSLMRISYAVFCLKKKKHN